MKRRPKIAKNIEVRRNRVIVPSTGKTLLPLTLAFVRDEIKEYNPVNVQEVLLLNTNRLSFYTNEGLPSTKNSWVLCSGYF